MALLDLVDLRKGWKLWTPPVLLVSSERKAVLRSFSSSRTASPLALSDLSTDVKLIAMNEWEILRVFTLRMFHLALVNPRTSFHKASLARSKNVSYSAVHILQKHCKSNQRTSSTFKEGVFKVYWAKTWRLQDQDFERNLCPKWLCPMKLPAKPCRAAKLPGRGRYKWYGKGWPSLHAAIRNTCTTRTEVALESCI
jgi:hypothetical protein